MSYVPPTGSASQLRRPALGELQGPDYSAKRQRVLQPISGTPASSFAAGEEYRQEVRPDADDVLQHLARHGGKIRELEELNGALQRRVGELTADLETETNRRRALQADLAYAKEVNAQPNHVGEQLEQLLHQEKQRRVAADDNVARLTRSVAEKDRDMRQLEQQVDTAKQRLLQEQRSKREEITAMQQRLAEAMESSRQELRAKETAAASAHQRLKQEAARSAELEQQLQQETARCQQLSQQLVEMGAGSAEQVVAACQRQEREGRVQELETLVATLKEQLQACKAPLRTSSPLAKASGPSAAVLQEQLAAARRELAEAGRQRAEHLRVQGAHAQLEVEVAAWRDAAKVMGAGRPAEAKAAFEKLHSEVAEKQAKAGGLAAEMRTLVQTLEDVKRARAAAEQLLGEREKALQEAEAQLARVRAVVGSMAQERETLQGLLASYKQMPEDEALAGDAVQLAAQCRLLDQQLQLSRQQHAAQMEQVQGLLADVARLQGEQQELRDALRVAQSGQAAAEERTTRLERELSYRAREVDALQKRLGQGEHNPSLSRCLQHVNNPLTALMARQTEGRVRALVAENDALRQQLEVASAGGSQGGVEVAAKEAEAKVQRQRAEDAEKQLRRTKAVVKERLQSIRDAVLHLFGYRMALSSGDPDSGGAPTYLLHPANHPDPNATLIFRLTEGRASARSWELIPTAYSQQLTSEVDTYITRFRSIPTFTANITMNLFNTQDAD